MSGLDEGADQGRGDTAPGDAEGSGAANLASLRGYLIGLSIASLLTAIAFYLTATSLVWAPSIPIAIFVLAVAQMGVHLVFFLHLTTGDDNVNNVLALAFGLLIVGLLVVGSLWIMSHLNHNMVPMERVMQMQR